jgi:hypothetical protein
LAKSQLTNSGEISLQDSALSVRAAKVTLKNLKYFAG